MPVLIYLVGECPKEESVLDMRLPSGHGLLHAPLLWEIAKDRATEAMEAFAQGKTSWGILFWIPLMAGADDVEVVKRWRGMVDALPEEQHRGDVIRVGMAFAELARRGQVWRQVLEEFKMTESPIVNEWIEEAVNQREMNWTREMLLLTLRTRFGEAVT